MCVLICEENFLHQRIKKDMFLLKEMAIFSTFFSKVRYLPYNAKKCAKNSHFFKQKHAIYDVTL